MLAVAVFASGIGPRPAGAGWDRLYDVVLYNCAYLPAAAAAWTASVRVRAERLAWRSLTVALLLYALANALRTLASGTAGNGPYPPAIDLLALVAYLLLYVAMVGLIRARVPRFHPSMWLDGVIGALGTTSLGVAFLIGPYRTAQSVALINLAMPVMDVLLLALLVAVGSILGLRMDRSLCTGHPRAAAVLAGDVVLFARMVEGTYVDGGPTELLWLVGICFAALAAHGAAPRPRAGRRALARGPATARPPADLQPGEPVRARGGLGRRAAVHRRLAGHRLRRRRDRPDGGHLPRGAVVPRGQAAGPHRRADRAGQPPGPARGRGAGADHGERPAARPRCCCSTSTASRRSTTASGTRRATTCSARSAPAWSPPCARARSSRGSAATSSPSCCRRRRSTRPRSGPNGSGSSSSSPSPSRTSGCTSA